MNPFGPKGRVRRGTERATSFDGVVLYLRQRGGLSKRKEASLRKGWSELDDAQRAFLLSQPRERWAQALQEGSVREWLTADEEEHAATS